MASATSAPFQYRQLPALLKPFKDFRQENRKDCIRVASFSDEKMPTSFKIYKKKFFHFQRDTTDTAFEYALDLCEKAIEHMSQLELKSEELKKCHKKTKKAFIYLNSGALQIQNAPLKERHRTLQQKLASLNWRILENIKQLQNDIYLEMFELQRPQIKILTKTNNLLDQISRLQNDRWRLTQKLDSARRDLNQEVQKLTEKKSQNQESRMRLRENILTQAEQEAETIKARMQRKALEKLRLFYDERTVNLTPIRRSKPLNSLSIGAETNVALLCEDEEIYVNHHALSSISPFFKTRLAVFNASSAVRGIFGSLKMEPCQDKQPRLMIDLATSSYHARVVKAALECYFRDTEIAIAETAQHPDLITIDLSDLPELLEFSREYSLHALEEMCINLLLPILQKELKEEGSLDLAIAWFNYTHHPLILDKCAAVLQQHVDDPAIEELLFNNPWRPILFF